MIDLALFASSTLLCVLLNWHKRYASNDAELTQALKEGKTLNSHEIICLVTSQNEPLSEGGYRWQMRLENLWHRATYVLVRHEPGHLEQHGDHPSAIFVLVQRRSMRKDYCQGRLDPTPGGVVGFKESYLENATRELREEMGIDTSENGNATLVRLFTFPYQDERVRVWGDFYECIYHGALRDLKIQEEEVDSIERMSLQELARRLESTPEQFMPDACHAMKLYFQRRLDLAVNRRILKGYSSSDLERYNLRPKPAAIFFDCDDCLYFDDWTTANQLTQKIEDWCVNHGLRKGQAYELYKAYGTALRGLIAEGYLENSDEAVGKFLQDVHDIPVGTLLNRDEKLRELLLRIDPSIPKYIFTSSVRDHAERCLKALGIEDLFVDVIDCRRCNLETKHSRYSFEVAMEVAGVKNPEQCIFFDDNLTNIRAAWELGWRSVLVGLVSRDSKLPISSEHAELEIDRIHDMERVFPDLFA